ncbi:hypothetical protein KC19_3G105300 [Ceratodon purpureus]|uniref:Uncharacterized protein n=1 Tax=Ceratodon purpureus TaxID=3225 RepID=A0A8T0IIB8_CERPU|nr:hypothetical protein KC19_3G105300 [Ceratodon purpureus]
MARANGALTFFTLALACLVATAAARESPFGEEKTYAPPYGSGSSPVTPVTPVPDVPYSPPYSPTPSGDSPVVPTPVVPTTPDVPYSPTPYTPTPYTPTDPAPTTPAPTTPGSCSWWSSNTSNFPDIISIFTTLLDVFQTISGGSGGSGGAGSIISSIFGNQMTVYQGLTNTRTDGYGALARQGSAAILNAYSRPREYPYSPFQVKLQFKNALGNQQSAFQMARVFENANNALGVRH